MSPGCTTGGRTREGREATGVTLAIAGLDDVPADSTDLDHSIEWRPDGAGGPTAETNLAVLHRGHHNLKTAAFWDSDQSVDGTLRWTTATGRTITTYPYVYDHPDNLPIRTSPLEARHGSRLAQVLNPDIPQICQHVSAVHHRSETPF